MRKLLVAASMAAGLALGVVPAFAQHATTSRPGWAATTNKDAASSAQPQN